ncbi:MAG: hypothetical protein Kow00121_45730 [Elainellaceae cyanobacterium]
MNPNSFHEVYVLYREHIFATNPLPKAEATWNTSKTAILRFVLYEFGFERENPRAKMTKAEVEAAEEFLKTVSIRSLTRVRGAIAKALKTLEATESSRNTYTSRINQFIEWAEQQVWWITSRSKNKTLWSQCCPPIRTGDTIRHPKLIPGKGPLEKYTLKEQQLPESTRLKLRAMIKFLTEPNNSERSFKRIEESTANGYRVSVLLILGWFHKFRNPSVPLEELSLDLVFPVFDEDFLDGMSEKELKKFWRTQKADLKKWLCDYRTFLQQFQHSYSPYTWLSKLEAVLAVARYQWANEIEHKDDYRNIPTMRQLREELGALQEEMNAWSESGRYAADQTQKWPDVPEGKNVLEVIQETVVEQLRLRCKPRTGVRAQVRPSMAIAVCQQRFLMWVEHALIPSHRQQVARTEQVATSCPIQKPSEVPRDGLYQPLPPDSVLPKRHDNSVEANFLCRLYSYKGKDYPGGVWIRVIRDYKTWKTHGDQEYVIPNQTFNDGSQLYDYIERYLYGYWLPGSFRGSYTYTWGQPELEGQQGKWISAGRAEFNPIDCCSVNTSNQVHWTWGNLFLMPTQGIPLSDISFSSAFATASLSTTGKWITPHILRSVWATWGYEQGLSDAELRSLAYSMGMTVETLRKTYERCTSEEKRKAIEKLLEERLLNAQGGEVFSVEKLIRLSRKLNLADRQKLVTALLDTAS